MFVFMAISPRKSQKNVSLDATALRHPHFLKRRNGVLFDIWSIVHFVTGVGMGWLMDPVVAIVLMVAWEPLEVFVISPLVARLGITFGYEKLSNSLSDIVFDSFGVLVGAFALTALLPPPFHLF